MSPLLRENRRTPAAYVGDVNSLFWNFISFPHKPSYSVSFLHWIFSVSYPYLTTLYIFNSIVSWSPKSSPLWIPWVHRGWTRVQRWKLGKDITFMMSSSGRLQGNLSWLCCWHRNSGNKYMITFLLETRMQGLILSSFTTVFVVHNTWYDPFQWSLRRVLCCGCFL